MTRDFTLVVDDRGRLWTHYLWFRRQQVLGSNPSVGSTSPSVNWLWVRTTDIVALPHSWELTGEVAEDLMKHKTVKGRDPQQLLRQRRRLSYGLERAEGSQGAHRRRCVRRTSPNRRM